ncbi:serine hydrolase domain-containing protein [Sphingobium boeckii]|uniref:CubicO group peptidase (Beta-lactamase class C family) n=1 Tax=Sphingobium boeckii TaxID=1082345 RepID=A0A7W9AJG0_9SPHN|nr:serine hydrolase [Sphingobium boeckii]MBB5686683.1 CubicO group peptidase (beta-lactamase class C family) [Sphingobium boeckii]
MKSGGILTRYDPMERVEGARKARPLPLAAADALSVTPEALDQASAYAKASNASAMIVWRDGKLQRADYFKGKDRNSQIVSKSLSKPITAIAVGRAIAMGKIKSVDQPVADFIPEWRGTPKEPMLIRHLLDMRSGLLEQMYSDDPEHPINRAYIDPDHGWHIINDYPLTHEPGRYYGYGNAVAELIAVVIERATGTRYGDFIGKQILAPIGAAGGEIWVNRPGGLAHSGCCMTLPAESWLRLGILLMNDGVADGRRLLPKGYVDDMAHGTPENPHYGMGLWVAGPYLSRRGFAAPSKPGPKVLHSQPYLDKDLFMFDGNANQLVFISRAARTVILRIGDAPPPSPEWDNSALPNIILGGIIWKKGETRPVAQAAP